MKLVTVARETPASPDQVWSILADGWKYPSWVVGASRVRAVEAAFPAEGARVHHSVGAWPILVDDRTEVLTSTPGRALVLDAAMRPVGRAKVEITLTPSGTGTRIEMREDIVSGPASWAPKAVRQAAIRKRNIETLLRLSLLAEKQSDPTV